MRTAMPSPRCRLPSPADLFVGRDGELAALSRLLDGGRTRLVTLTGPPGIGKTRLAIVCANAYAERSRCATFFLDLAPLREPARVLVELAQALEIEPRGGTDLIGQLASSLATEDCLIVLDNFEHLMPAAADLGLVLAECPRLVVIATSRERLRLSAEQEFPVPPLAMPTHEDVTDLAALAANPSAALLVDRARRTNPGFTLTAANATVLVSACVRLEGLPLAIELAAARLKLLTLGELVFRLGSRMDVLAGNAQDVPARQRALRNAIEWSYDLLSAEEQAVFRALSVFAGGWALDDAESVCAGMAGDVTAVVESLLEKSLIRRLPDDGETAEFAMLESLSEYAGQLLEAHGETGRMRAQHARHYAGLAVQWEESIGHPAEPSWWLRVGRYQADLRAGLDHCLQTGRHDRALPLAAALGWYHYTRGDFGGGQALVDSVLAADEAQEARATVAGCAEHGARAGVLIAGGILAWASGQPDRARDLLGRALDRSERQRDSRRAAIACAFLGHVARAGRHWDEAASWHQRAAAGFGRQGNAQGVAWAQHDLGLLARDRGDLAGAVHLLRSGLRDFRALDYPWAVAWAAWGLGTTLCAQGEVAQARPLLAEALESYRDLSDPNGVTRCLEALAQVASQLAQHQTAARLIGAAAALRGRLAAPPGAAEQARIAVIEQAAVRVLGSATAEQLTLDGQAMPARQAAELAIAVARGTAPGDPDRKDPGRAVRAPLTRREREVAALVATGRTNRQIGRTLGISEKTTEVHLHHVMTKLDARGRAEVAAWAVTHHLPIPGA